MHEIREKMQVHLEAQRGRDRQRALSEEKSQVLERIQTAKADGKKILLLNGKVIIDLAVKYTKGCVHSDMSEWITHAVEFAGRHQDSVLLLVKPHPHENREDLTLTSEKIDNLRSLIRCDLNDATIYLDNDMFTNSELVPYMDVGLVWNGTSSLEFAAQGKKVLVADVWGHFDYPIGFVYPKTLAEYESYLLDPSLIEEPEDISDRAITFLEYMGSDDVRVVNAYSQTTLMNFNQFESTIDAEAVDRFVAQGDKALCCRFDELI
jgi:capsular polysaccharide export protein